MLLISRFQKTSVRGIGFGGSDASSVKGGAMRRRYWGCRLVFDPSGAWYRTEFSVLGLEIDRSGNQALAESTCRWRVRCARRSAVGAFRRRRSLGFGSGCESRSGSARFGFSGGGGRVGAWDRTSSTGSRGWRAMPAPSPGSGIHGIDHAGAELPRMLHRSPRESRKQSRPGDWMTERRSLRQRELGIRVRLPPIVGGNQRWPHRTRPSPLARSPREARS